MTDKPELLPCPFCGGEAYSWPPTTRINYSGEEISFCTLVTCTDCGVDVSSNDYDETMHSAIDKWNDRCAPLDSSFNPGWCMLEATRQLYESIWSCLKPLMKKSDS